MVLVWKILRFHKSSIFSNYFPRGKLSCYGALQHPLKYALNPFTDQVKQIVFIQGICQKGILGQIY